MFRSRRLLVDLQERLQGLEHQAELMKTVLIVKEPSTIQASQAFDGLRKKVIAGAAERRSHLTQIVAMAVAVSRATSVSDLVPQVQEWMDQAGIMPIRHVPVGSDASHVFEDIGGKGLDGALEIVEPAYFDTQTGTILRLGRAKLAARTAKVEPVTAEEVDAQDVDAQADEDSKDAIA